MSDADFDALVADVIENPDIIMSKDLTPEQIIEIQKRLNPYAGIAGEPPAEGYKKVAAASYTNLREDYLRRLTMTSLVGFVFRMLSEWTVPPEARRWTPVNNSKNDEATSRPFESEALVERLEATLAVAKEAAAAAAEAAKLKREAMESDVILPAHADAKTREAVEAKYMAHASAAAKAAGLLYAATHGVHRVGTEAGLRLRATAEAGLEHPEVKAIIGKYPLPAPPGQVEMPADLAKKIIEGFLHEYFEFDPSIHTRSAHDAKKLAAAVSRIRVGQDEVAVDTADPTHMTLEALLAAAPRPAPEHASAVAHILKTPRTHNAVIALLRDEQLAAAAQMALANEETFRHYLMPVSGESGARIAAEIIPPQDTFHRWAYYTEVNYEELRTITEAIYPEKPDLDWAIGLWEIFEGTPKEVDEAFNEHCQRYQDEITSPIKTLEFGAWSLLGDFKENRKNIQIYNRHTEVLKRILDRHAEDKGIGAALMRDRVRKTKAANIAEAGPDAPGLARYKQNVAANRQDLAGKGAEKVISAAEMRRLEKARGNMKAAKELELLEQLEETISTLEAAEKVRALTLDETQDLERARRDIVRAREMLEVPEDAIQVDVFTNDPASGTFAKSRIYTKADTEDDVKSASRPDEPSHPALAPFALEHIRNSMTAERTDADRKAEALGDAANK